MSDLLVNEELKLRQKAAGIGISLCAVALALFHMYTASFGVMPSYAQAAIHWAIIGTFILLSKPLKFKGGYWLDYLLIVANIFVSIYLLGLQERFVMTAGRYTDMDIYVAILAVILAIEISRRVIGKILPVIAVVFILYALFGNKLVGMFRTSTFSLKRVANTLYTASDGLYGQTLGVSAQYIYLFVLFGSILEMTGAGEFFVDLSFALVGKVRGGPAQAAVYSSMLMGTINGSGAANVVTTGTFTIPLMKKTGFRGAVAGAVEAVASSGGQIMPPVMGAVAFLMSEMTGIEYGKIALASLLPALLYYVTLSAAVYFYARKDNIPVSNPEDIKPFLAVLKKGWLYFLPLIVLIGMLVSGYSAQKAGFFAILVSLGVGFLINRENMTPAKLLAALKGALTGIAGIAAACILAGVVMGVINLTGLGLKISSIITTLANGNLLLALVLSMLTSLLLGMGLPTSAAYMVLAVLVAPALITMGASPLSAHLFILYFGALSTITPPVALSTFAAAGIAKSNIWETGLEGMKLASTGFIIPFIFVFNQNLLLIGAPLDIAVAVVTAVLGCVLLGACLYGWFVKNLSMVSRLLLVPCAIALIWPDILVSAIGLAAAAVILALSVKMAKEPKTVTP